MAREMRPGIVASLEQTIRFLDWAEDMGDRLTPAAIKEKFGCSRATSYRWFAAYRDARAAVVEDQP
jgi:transposase